MTRRVRALGLFLGIFGAVGAAAVLAEPDKRTREAIKELQKAKAVEDRARAASSLGGNADPAAVDALALALGDRDADVREAAASALWKTGEKGKAAEPALRKALEDSPGRVIVRAAGALEAMGVKPEELAEARRRVLERRVDETTAFLAARGLIGLDPPAEILPGLLGYLSRRAEAAARPGGWSDNHDDVESAEKALLRLAQTKDRSAIRLLEDELDRSPAAAPSLLKTLAAFKPPPQRFAETLVDQMRSRFPKSREAAAWACRELTADRDVDVWAPEAGALTRDREESVRNAALWALQEAGGRAATATPDVVRLLESDPSARVRAHAASVLGEMGDASKPVPQKAKLQMAEQAKAALAAALADKDKDVADNALSSYNRLFLPSAEAVETLTRVAEGTGPAPLRMRALMMLRNRQGQAAPVLARIRALTTSPEIGADARTAVEWIERGGPGSPNPLVAATPAGGSRASSGASAPSSPARKPDPGAEARGLAALRELKIAFDEGGYYHTLSQANLEGVRAFLDAGMSPSHRFAVDSQRSPLMVVFFGVEACRSGEPTGEATREIVKSLIAAGADVNQTDENGNTALMFAAGKCDRFVLKQLLGAGAKVGARNKMNMTALQMSIYSGDPAVEELILAGARLDAETGKAYLEGYKDNPKAIALVRKAMAK